jgi:hypothetical protein
MKTIKQTDFGAIQLMSQEEYFKEHKERAEKASLAINSLIEGQLGGLKLLIDDHFFDPTVPKGTSTILEDMHDTVKLTEALMVAHAIYKQMDKLIKQLADEKT